MNEPKGKESVTDFLNQAKLKKETKKMNLNGEETAKPVEEVAVETVVEPVCENSAKPDETAPQVESFASLGGIKRVNNLSNVREIDLDLLDIEALEVPEINDSKGYLSGKVRDFMGTYNVSVVPLEALGFSNKVKVLRDYTITELGGKKFASSMNEAHDRQAVIEYANAIRDKYADSGVVDESVMKNIIVNGKTYRTIRFNHYELRILKSTLRNFGFICYEDLNGDIRINVGGSEI